MSWLVQFVPLLGEPVSSTEIRTGLAPVKAKTKADTRTRPGFVEDLPENVWAATAWLKTQPVKARDRGEGAEAACLGLAMWLRDMGISEKLCAKLIWDQWIDRCPDIWDYDFVELKCANAFKFAENAPGRDAATPVAEAFAGIAPKPSDDFYKPITLEAQPVTKRPHPSVWITGNDIGATAPPRVREILPGILEEHMVKMIEGERSQHKSRLLLYDAAHLVTGRPAYDAPVVTKCKGIYLNYENPTPEMNWRVWATKHYLKLTAQEPDLDLRDLHIANLRDDYPSLLDVSRDGEVTVTSFMREIQERIDRNAQAGHHTFLAIDGLFDAIRMPDVMRNESLVALDVIRYLEQTCSKLNCSIEALVHPTRTASRSKVQGSYAGTWTNRPRGFDTMAGEPKMPGIYTRTIVKRSHGQQGQKFHFEYHHGTLRPVDPRNTVAQEPTDEL